MLKCLLDGKKRHVAELEPSDWRDFGKSDRLSCPECHSSLVFRKGKYKSAHFAHKSGANRDCKASQESEEHIAGKSLVENLLIARFGKDCVFVEETLENGQEADVLLVLNNKRIAIEIQFSPQDGNKWQERTQKYRDIGVSCLWILGYRKELKALITKEYTNLNCAFRFGQSRELAFVKSGVSANVVERIFLPRHLVDPNCHIVHLLSITKEHQSLSIGYVNREKKTTWGGRLLELSGNDWGFDADVPRFVPLEEMKVRTVSF